MTYISLKNSGMRLLAVLTCAMVLATAHAYDYVDANGIAYDLDANHKTAAVTYKDASYGSYNGSVIIPSTIVANGDTYSVTAVGDNAFRACNQLTAVTLGDNVATVGKRAFLACSALEVMNITPAVNTIGDYAFADCSSLQNVIFNNDMPVTLGTGAFLRCSALNSVEWNSCSNLDGKGGMTSLGTNAFAGCSSLSQIFLPGNIEELGNSIFDGCTSLSTITLMVEQPIAVKGDPFSLNASQVTLKVPSGVTAGAVAASYRAAVGWRDYNIVELGYSFVDSQGLKYNKQAGGSVALTGCQGTVNTLVVPMSITGYKGEIYNVTAIGDGAFKSSTIKKIDISNAYKLKSIGVEAFAQCKQLNQVTLVEGLVTMGQNAFNGCTVLTTIKLPSTLKIIPQGAFYGCTRLTQVKLVHGVTSIETMAFAQCLALASITLPRSVAVVEPHAFAGDTSLGSIVVAEESDFYASVDGALFERLLDFESPEELQGSLLKLVIYPCGKKDVNFYCPNGVVELCSYAFEGASSLKYLALPATVVEFGESCFSGSGIETINYRGEIAPDIDATVFEGFNRSNVALQVPLGAVENYQQAAEWNGFKSITERYDIWHNNSCAYDWNADGQVTVVDIKSPAVDSNGVLVFPSGVNLSGVNYVATGMKNTSTANVAGLVKTFKINNQQFNYIDTSDGINPLATFTSLTTFTLNAANKAFTLDDGILYTKDRTKLYYYMRNKTDVSITLDSKVDTIMPQAFANNNYLQRVICDSKLKVIGVGAFENCTRLSVIDNVKKVQSIKARAFKNTSLSLFCGGMDLKEIGDEAFAGCTQLASFPFAHGALMSIGDRAFMGCNTLKVVILNGILNHIGDNAFEGCTSLESVFFTSDVKEFGQALFKGCRALKKLWMCNATVPVVDHDTFEGNNLASHYLWVPSDALAQYEAHPVWGRFGHINSSTYLDNGADVNNDKYVNALDVMLIYQVLLGYIHLDMLGRYDVNHDGAVNAADITLVYNYILSGIEVERAYTFVNDYGAAIPNTLSMSKANTHVFAHCHANNQYVTSGFSGVTDNAAVVTLQPSMLNGAQCIEIVPHSQGLVTIVMIVESSDGVSYFREFPLKVVN